MPDQMQTIPLCKLLPHPHNPNRMSNATFNKLVRNIQRTGRYEPLIVRPHPQQRGLYQIINGHHRAEALAKLGHTEANAIVWDVDDRQTEILLATLNRLGGTDLLEKKLALLRSLRKRASAAELAKLLPQTAKQIEKLTKLALPKLPAPANAKALATPMVFFLNESQRHTVEHALSLAAEATDAKTKAQRHATALAIIAQRFLEHSDTQQAEQK